MTDVAALCSELRSDDPARAFRARQALLQAAVEAGAPGRDADRAALAKSTAAALAAVKPEKNSRGDATLASIRTVGTAAEICRVLALVGGDAEVPALADCLKQIDLREPARRCLARMTCAGATDALIAALKTASGNEFRVGLVSALGRKGGSSAVDALKAAATDAEPEVRLAAAEALAEITLAEHDAVIAAVGVNNSPRAAARAARARLRLAHGLAAAGDRAAAKAIFQSLASGAPEPQKKAAAAALASLG